MTGFDTIIRLNRILSDLERGNQDLLVSFIKETYDELGNELINKIIFFIGIRPLKIEDYCISIAKINNFAFKNSVIEFGNRKCPKLLFELFKIGWISMDEIEREILKYPTILCQMYFYDIHKIFSQENYDYWGVSEFYEEKYVCAPDDHKDYKSFGFPRNSVQYAIKYDEIDEFKNHCTVTGFDMDQELESNPFEWSEINRFLSLLAFSAHFGSIKCFKFLIMSGVEPIENDLDSVVFSGNLDIFHVYISEDEEELTRALPFSVNYFHFELFEWIYSRIPIKNIDISELYQSRNYEIINKLIEDGVDINKNGPKLMNDSSGEKTILHHACLNCDFQMCSMLIAKGVFIDPQDSFSSTPLLCACEMGSVPIVDLLIQNGANIYEVDYSYKLFLMVITAFILHLESVIWIW